MPQLIQQKAVITYVDDFLLWPSIGPKLIEHLPIRDIVVNDIRLQQQRKIKSLDLEWRVFDNSEFLKLRDISPFTVPKKFPFLNLYICKCDDINTFNQVVKSRLQQWLDIVNVVPYQQSLIVYVTQGNESKTKAIFEKIKQMSTKKQCCKLIFDNKFEDKSWAEFFDLIKSNVVEGFTHQLVHYTEELKRIDQHRGNQGWNFSKYCLIKESLARLYENMNMFDEAIKEYEEIKAAYDLKSFSGDSVADFNPNMGIVDLPNKPYQQLILEGSISDFDFQHYLLNKKIYLFDFRNQPEEISENVKLFLTTFSINIHEELLVSWKVSIINSILNYLKKAITSTHLSEKQVFQLHADYGELSHYQVTLIKGLLLNNTQLQWHVDSLLIQQTLNTRNNAMEFMETACLSAAFKYETIGMQRHGIKMKKELAILYQILEFHQDAVNYLNNLLNHKLLPNKMRNSMLNSLLVCYKTLDKPIDEMRVLLQQCSRPLLHLQDQTSKWDLILSKAKENELEYDLLSIFHIPKVVPDSVGELKNLVVINVSFHNHFQFPIYFDSSVLTITSSTTGKEYTLHCRKMTLEKDTILQYTSLYVIPTGKYNLTSNLFQIHKMKLSLVYKGQIEIPPIISAFSINLFDYYQFNNHQLGIHVTGPQSDVINGKFNLHLKQDSKPVEIEQCMVNDKQCIVEPNGTILLPEMSNISEFKLQLVNVGLLKTCTISCIFSFDDAIGKNHVCSTEEIYTYRDPIKMEINSVLNSSELNIINQSQYGMLVHHMKSTVFNHDKFTILPTEIFNIYFDAPMTLEMIFSFVDGCNFIINIVVFHKMLAYLQVDNKLPNALRHELKSQFLVHVDFIHISEKGFVVYSDLEKMISNIPDVFSKHVDLQRLKEFELSLLNDDLTDVPYPCYLKHTVAPIPEPMRFTVNQLIKVDSCTLMDIVEVEYVIETEALEYMAIIEDRSDWIVQGFCKKLLQKTDALKLKLQPVKVGMLSLPDCCVEYPDKKLMVKPTKGFQLRVLPEKRKGLQYFHINQ